MNARGRFISFEGGEGCGKTTQRNRLAEKIRALGYEVVVTRELGGTEGAELVRPVVQSGDVTRWDARSEALLIYGARHDHTEKLIKPALARGAWVVSDRFFDTTTVYQGYAGGMDFDRLKSIHRAAIDDFVPDLTLIFDLDPSLGLQRAMADAAVRTEENTRFERKGLAFHQKVREAYLQVARDNTARCVVIDASGTIPEVQARVWQAVSQKFGLT
jgi:dTMP kinase